MFGAARNVRSAAQVTRRTAHRKYPVALQKAPRRHLMNEPHLLGWRLMRTRSGPDDARLPRSAVTASASRCVRRLQQRSRWLEAGSYRTRQARTGERTHSVRERELHARRVSESRRVFSSEEEPSCGRWHQTGLTALIMCVRDKEGQIVSLKVRAAAAGARITEITHCFPRMFAFDGSKSKWTSEAVLHPSYSSQRDNVICADCLFTSSQ